jgi:hypothetical protein
MLRQPKKQPSQKPTEYPSGVFLHTEKGYFYVFKGNQRYLFLTTRVLDSWAPQRIIECSEDDAAVKRLTIFSKMKFRNGSLLYSQANGSMYLVSDGKLRHITNPDVLEQLAIERKSAVWVSKEELNLHEMGLELN